MSARRSSPASKNQRRGASRRSGPPRPAPSRLDESYGDLSKRPLHILLFLLPLVLLYEIGAAVFLAGEGVIESIRAYRLLAEFFHRLGVSGLYLPGVAMVVVLLVWHLLRRDRWRARGGVLLGMLAESLFWTPPLLVLGQMVRRIPNIPDTARPIGAAAEFAISSVGELAAPILGPALASASAAGGDAFAALTLPARATLAVGAGLYEELLFRFVAISMFHFIAVDVGGLKHRTGNVVAVTLAALAFALYHDIAAPAGGVDLILAGFYFVAGLYFGLIFVLRGFGIVVAVHVIYDMVVLLLQK